MTDASTSYDHPDTPTPAADLQVLGARLVGTWRVRGGAEGTVRFEWMDGGFFLVQHVELEQYGNTMTGEWAYPEGGGYQSTSTRVDS